MKDELLERDIVAGGHVQRFPRPAWHNMAGKGITRDFASTGTQVLHDCQIELALNGENIGDITYLSLM